MARLPSGHWLIQQVENDIILFQEFTEEEIVKFDIRDIKMIRAAQLAIQTTDRLSEDDKAWAHYWSGYFYAGAHING